MVRDSLLDDENYGMLEFNLLKRAMIMANKEGGGFWFMILVYAIELQIPFGWFEPV